MVVERLQLNTCYVSRDSLGTISGQDRGSWTRDWGSARLLMSKDLFSPVAAGQRHSLLDPLVVFSGTKLRKQGHVVKDHGQGESQCFPDDCDSHVWINPWSTVKVLTSCTPTLSVLFAGDRLLVISISLRTLQQTVRPVQVSWSVHVRQFRPDIFLSS